jgi:hypothetical protein
LPLALTVTLPRLTVAVGVVLLLPLPELGAGAEPNPAPPDDAQTTAGVASASPPTASTAATRLFARLLTISVVAHVRAYEVS